MYNIYYYYSFKIFLPFWLVKTAHIIFHNQLLLTKYWTNDVKSAACWKLLTQWHQNEVKSAARYRLLNHWPENLRTRLCYFGERKNKEQNGKTPSRTGRYFEWIIKQLILNLAFIGYEEFCRSRRVLSTSASVDNTLLDLQNSSYPPPPHSIIAKYPLVCTSKSVILVSEISLLVTIQFAWLCQKFR